MSKADRKRRPGRPALLEELPNDVVCRNVTRYLKLGVTHEHAAEALGISIPTFYAWVKKYPQFSKAVKDGEIDADAIVASAMFSAATGNRRTVEVVTKLKDGPDQERVEISEITIEDPLNVSAQIFWLKNRRKDLWRDLRANELSGPDGRAIEIQQNHVLTGRQLDVDERAQLRAFLEANATDVTEIEDDETEEGDDDDDSDIEG